MASYTLSNGRLTPQPASVAFTPLSSCWQGREK